ncbi:MAG TPA: AcvB/VirJ family lysyl-phosphatidylglycerol hydrolase [Gallionella sp.]|nr:AcvB/VirJ family lysyl-phosphatidylglycerol hydrolase [Gallionella sp.]
MMIRFIAVVILLVAAAGGVLAGEIREMTDSFGPFGTLHIYQTEAQPKQVVLFISGDGGWNLGVVDMARSLAELDSMVVGIDITHYLRQLDSGSEKCSYPAAHFEALSQYLQKKHNFPQYILPMLVGYSSGATLVYTILAQSPVNTFAGGISMGFCPDLKTGKPMCRGSSMLTSTRDAKLGFIYRPVSTLAAKLYVLQGDIDQVCSTPDTKAFLDKVNNAELVELAKVGHGFSVQKNWMPQFREAFQRIADAQQAQAVPAPRAAEVSDLPLVELPGNSDTLAVVVSGDGGWASLDRQIAEALNKDGIAVVGLNSLHYFWERKTPEVAGKDLARILDHYGKLWRAKKFILVGYSQGADALPFMASRLPEELKSKVGVIALLGLEPEVDFEFHVADWLPGEGSGSYQVVPEVQKLKGVKVLCIYGADESGSACLSLNRNDFGIIEMTGGHHFGGDYERLANIILEHAR